ncbi:DNA-binding protein [Streptococcus pneumoniae]|nr:DNA-binding protein [Streptococcus pneumoniae]CAG5669328.1 DNA-binding protein [Streptococcus pneumoniae]CMW65079.1 DNA-binding protein [Streptococcus pneumoniae]
MAKNLKLKLARVERDLTQGQLAEAVGVTRQTIGLIEAGKIQSQSLALPVYLQMFRENPRPTILGGRR